MKSPKNIVTTMVDIFFVTVLAVFLVCFLFEELVSKWWDSFWD